MKYYLQTGEEPEREVTRAEYIQAERNAGFRPKSGNPGDTATGSFGYSVRGIERISGRTHYEPEDIAAIGKQYNNR